MLKISHRRTQKHTDGRVKWEDRKFVKVGGQEAWMLREAVRMGRWGRDRKEGGQRTKDKGERRKEKGEEVEWIIS